MGKNVELLLSTDGFIIPDDFNEEQKEFFIQRVEWKLERMRRADFDIDGEHRDLSENIFTNTEKETREQIGN